MGQTADELRRDVALAYGGRVREITGRDEMLVLADAGGAGCCASDTGDASCCGTETGEAINARLQDLYTGSGIVSLPATVTDVAFGCGNPTAIAGLKPGEVVLDLGSGGGIDCFLAARMVGETGRVYGVDMTPEMVSLARRNAAAVGARNVEFRLAEIEHLPFADAAVDVVISNCVINLAPDKDEVLREAFRVLRPGGRFQVSDMVWTGAAPVAQRDDIEAWAGCVAGALAEDEYRAKLDAAGFIDVTTRAVEYPGKGGLASADITAVRPG